MPRWSYWARGGLSRTQKRALKTKVCGSVSGGHEVMFSECSGPLIKGPFIPKSLSCLVFVSATPAVTMKPTKANLHLLLPNVQREAGGGHEFMKFVFDPNMVQLAEVCKKAPMG